MTQRASTLARRFAVALAGAAALGAASGPATALVVQHDDDALHAQAPPDDPGWDSVGHRLDGPTVIYLGNGWVLTANHVGAGVVVIGGQRYDNVGISSTRFVNPDGSHADLLAYRIQPAPDLPDLPILPIRTAAPMPGEEVLIVGVGRTAAEPVEYVGTHNRVYTGYALGPDAKRWGTNAIAGWPVDIDHADNRNRVLVTTFSPADDPSVTAHEAQAATGDSGGAVFALRNPNEPGQGWALAGVVSSVNGSADRPPDTTFHGDYTFALDLSHYRNQIIALVRPECSNEIDDDGDGRVDYPADRGCQSMADDIEGSSHSIGRRLRRIAPWAGGLSVGAGLLVWMIRHRRSAAPASDR